MSTIAKSLTFAVVQVVNLSFPALSRQQTRVEIVTGGERRRTESVKLKKEKNARWTPNCTCKPSSITLVTFKSHFGAPPCIIHQNSSSPYYTIAFSWTSALPRLTLNWGICLNFNIRNRMNVSNVHLLVGHTNVENLTI